MRPSVFHVKSSVQSFGIWYAIWHYGANNVWTIFVATRMIKLDDEAQREHATWLYNK